MEISHTYSYLLVPKAERKIITPHLDNLLSSINCKLFHRTLLLVVQFVCVMVNSGNTQTNTFPASGNVGIGISNPSGKLHINGPMDGSIPTLRIGSSDPGNIHVPSGASTGGYNIDFHTWRDLVPEQIGARIRAERVNNYFGDNALIQSMDLSFYTSDGMDQSRLTEKLRIKSNGDVGIGVSDPQGYKLAVGGSMIAESIKVKTLSNWPDYVFEKTYDLQPLTEVEQFIKEKKHLPDVPSAKEVQEQGVALGEMNAILLRKIEELTLHVIALKKENEKIQEENKRQQLAIEQILKK